MNKAGERLINGLVKENPTFVLMLGMCPTLAVTSSAINGLGMGLTTAVVLALSNMIISLLRKIIPSRVRIPAFIVIIASFVTVVQLLLEAYLPDLNDALGVYIPLIVVNCIILGRAEAYAYSNPPIASLFDGIGMGLGFSVALTAIGAVRELLGSGKIFGIDLGLPFEPIGIFVLAPGAFFVLAALTALQNYIKIRGEKKGKNMSKIQSGCNEDCMNCGVEGCSKRFYDTEAYEAEEMPEEFVEESVVSQEIIEKVVAEETVVEKVVTEETVEAETAPAATAKKAPKKKQSAKKVTAKKTPEVVEQVEEPAQETVQEIIAEEVNPQENTGAEEVKTEENEPVVEKKTASKKRASKKKTSAKASAPTTKEAETEEGKAAQEVVKEVETEKVKDQNPEAENAETEKAEAENADTHKVEAQKVVEENAVEEKVSKNRKSTKKSNKQRGQNAAKEAPKPAKEDTLEVLDLDEEEDKA